MNVTKLLRVVAVASVLLGSAHAVAAQTADEIVEKHLAAIGGRAALSKLTSRVMAGTITVATPAGEFSGPIEIWNQAPNKVRTLINLDLSNVGVGKMTIDQRFDGTTRVMLFTDEQPNVGRTDATSFAAMAEEASRGGIGLTTIGSTAQPDTPSTRFRAIATSPATSSKGCGTAYSRRRFSTTSRTASASSSRAKRRSATAMPSCCSSNRRPGLRPRATSTRRRS
jgi:hypothetical protein